MLVTKNDKVVCFDVDDTLVMWSWPEKFNDRVVIINNYGHNTSLVPHEKHIALMKQFKARGYYVIVWSQGGFEWANAVVEALDLTAFVDEVKTKPKWYVDDLGSHIWMTRSYFDMDGNCLADNPYVEFKDEDEDRETHDHG